MNQPKSGRCRGCSLSVVVGVVVAMLLVADLTRRTSSPSFPNIADSDSGLLRRIEQELEKQKASMLSLDEKLKKSTSSPALPSIADSGSGVLRNMQQELERQKNRMLDLDEKLKNIMKTVRSLTNSASDVGTSPAVKQQASQNAIHPENMFKSSAVKCPKKDLSKLKSYFRSQSEEDKELLVWFNGLCKGTYLEMGALEGEAYSNSWFFNKAPGMEWRGILIEASPSNFAKLQEKRTNEIAKINEAVCKTKSTVHFVEYTAMSGIWEFAPQSFKERWWLSHGITIDKTKPLTCRPLHEILSENSVYPDYFDFFSLDVEGAEFKVLESVDFDKVGFGVIVAECDRHDPLKNFALRTFLEKRGYGHFKTDERNCWFYNLDWADIYKDFY